MRLTKKSFTFLLSLILLLVSTGCGVTNDTKDKLFNALKKENIFGNDLEFIETIDSKVVSFVIRSNTYYIYKDSNNNYIGINYTSCNGDYTCDADYRVSVFNATLNEDITYIDEADVDFKDHYFIFDNKYADNCKYNMTLINSYYAYRNKSFFIGEYYTLELID